MAQNSIKFEYDAEVDAAYVRLHKGKIIGSRQVQPGVIVDFGAGEKILGLEILQFAKRFGSVAKSRVQQRTRTLKKTA